MNTLQNKLGQSILSGSILLGSLIPSHAQGVNSILCKDAAHAKETKNGKITINSNLVCSIKGTDDASLVSQLEFVAKKDKYDEVIVLLFDGMNLGKNRFILKLDARKKDTWDTIFYMYNKNNNTLTNLDTSYLDDALTKAKTIQ